MIKYLLLCCILFLNQVAGIDYFETHTYLNKIDNINDTDTRTYNHTYYTNFHFNKTSDSLNILQLIGPETFLQQPRINHFVEENSALFNFSQ